MILVQNRQLRLNGNKFSLLLLLVVVISVSSCGIFKKTEIYEDDNPPLVDGPNVNQPNGSDTIVWESDPDNYPPITRPTRPTRPNEDPTANTDTKDPVTTPTTPVSEYKATYKVAMLAPFYSSKSPAGQIRSQTSLRSLDFYGGMKLALEKLSTEGVNIELHSFDTEGSTKDVGQILSKSEMNNMDMIIGPMKKETLASTNYKSKSTQTVLVSPWNPNIVARENPYYIKVSPSLKVHCQELTRHARKIHPTQNIVLACKKDSKEDRYFKYFHDENKVIEGSASAEKFRELRAEYSDDIPVADYIKPGETTVFIIPSWEESFVSNLLRKIYSVKGNNKVIVYGMPQWKEFERIGLEYYENLNVHITNSVFADKEDPIVKQFRSDFFDAYGIVPEEDGYLGYDTMLYFGRLLNKRGSQFHHFVDTEVTNRTDYLHTKFNFEPIYRSGSDQFAAPAYYENKYVNMLEFSNFKFNLAK